MDARVKASMKWTDKNIVKVTVGFNRDSDSDLIEFMEKSGKGKATVIKDALRAFIDGNSD